MKNKFILGLLFVLSLGGFTSCFEEEDESYDGPLEVQFDSSPATAMTRTITVAANATRRDSFEIQLIGPHQSEDIVGTYMIDPKTTAVEGTEYSVLGTKGQYTIPAGSSFGYIKYTLRKPATAGKKLIFVLQDTDKVKASTNYKTATTTIQ